MKELERNCPICNSNDKMILYSMKFKLINNAILPDSFNVVSCKKCGFVFNDSSAVQEDYDRHYASNSIYESSELKGLGGINDINKFNEIFDRISPYLIKEMSIVDVGCAQGGMLSVLKENGYNNLNGMDLSIANLKLIEKNGITPWNNSICNINNINKKFDFIILSHILEHVCDLQTSVKNLKRIINDDGFAYIEVPNANKYFKYYPEAPFHYFNIEHINHFDISSLKNIFLMNNFDIIKTFETYTIVDASIKYPVVGIIIKSKNKDISYNIIDSKTCKKNVEKYIKQCTNDMKRINKIFTKIIKSNNKVIIWGAGNYAQWLINNSLLNSCKISCFIDKAKAKWGTKIEGIDVRSVDTLLNKEFNNSKTTIIVVAAVYKFEILKEINKMNLQCKHFVI